MLLLQLTDSSLLGGLLLLHLLPSIFHPSGPGNTDRVGLCCSGGSGGKWGGRPGADRGDQGRRDYHLSCTPCGVGVADAINLAKHADLLDELVWIRLEAGDGANLLVDLAIRNKGLQQ